MERSMVQTITPDYEALINEMGSQNFDVIRFASYRAASKLRFIQKKTNFYLVDIWNTIEAIRENGLHIYQDVSAEINISKLETFITSIYYQLSKRLPPSKHLNLDESVSSMLTFLKATYDPNLMGKVRVFAVKLALATLCSGKLIDKLRYMYSLISDPNTGLLITTRLDSFIGEILALTYCVLESNFFSYDQTIATSMFDLTQPIDLATFLNAFFNKNGPPPSLSWLMALHRMVDAESIIHPIYCEACTRQNFTGLRFKCQKCFNYNLCQDCFWRGRTSGSHNAETHSCKEYCYYKSPSKQIGRSLRKSFRCVPSQRKPIISISDEPTRRFNLTHIVPPSPIPSSHQPIYLNSLSSEFESLSNEMPGNFGKSPPASYNNFAHQEMRIPPDEEHRLIAFYAATLANHKLNPGISNLPPDQEIFSLDMSPNYDLSPQQQIISQLEVKNRQIMKEIRLLRQDKSDRELSNGATHLTGELIISPVQPDPIVIELSALRQRKDELETHLSALHDSRRDLLVQLEGLMKLLKNHGSLLSAPPSAPTSAVSTLNRNLNGAQMNTSTLSSTTSAHSDISSVTSGTSVASSGVNRDLLVAADSVTNAMSSLVKELNSEDEACLDEMALADKLTKKLGVRGKMKNSSEHLENTKNGEYIDSDSDEERLAYKLIGSELNKSKPLKTKMTNSMLTNTCTTTSDEDEESYIKTDDDDLDMEDEEWYKSSDSSKKP